jgi:hypothetical protein
LEELSPSDDSVELLQAESDKGVEIRSDLEIKSKNMQFLLMKNCNLMRNMSN